MGTTLGDPSIRTLLLTLALLLPASLAFGQATFVVNTTGDQDNGCSSGNCTLREALGAASDGDFIVFDFGSGSTPRVITVNSELPPLAGDNAMLDALDCLACGPVAPSTTAAIDGLDGQLGVTLTAGVSFPADKPLLRVTGNNDTVRGLNVAGGPSHGIVIESDDVTIEHCFLGTTPDGLAGDGNGGHGLYVDNAATATIGPGVISSSNGGHGLFADGPDSDGLVILDSIFGLDADATSALGNGGNGITLDGSNGEIDPFTLGAVDQGLVVSGNGGAGIFLNGNLDHWTLSASYVGIGAGGEPLGNTSHGLYMKVVSNKPRHGDVLDSIFGDNGGAGVFADSAADINYFGNGIGTDPLGVADLGNGAEGIYILATTAHDAKNHVIGDRLPENANAIAFNSGDGIRLRRNGSRENKDNGIGINQITDNGGLGIDLESAADDGPTTPAANQCADVTDFGNRGQGRAEIDSAEAVAGTLTVVGTSCDDALIDIYLASGDASGFGEPAEWLGEVTADSSGDWSFDVSFLGLDEGDLVTVVQRLGAESSEAAENVAIVECDSDGDGSVDPGCGGDDCDDNNGAVFPGATEVCNLLDDDCDELIDEDLVCGDDDDSVDDDDAAPDDDDSAVVDDDDAAPDDDDSAVVDDDDVAPDDDDVTPDDDDVTPDDDDATPDDDDVTPDDDDVAPDDDDVAPDDDDSAVVDDDDVAPDDDDVTPDDDDVAPDDDDATPDDDDVAPDDDDATPDDDDVAPDDDDVTPDDDDDSGLIDDDDSVLLLPDPDLSLGPGCAVSCTASGGGSPGWVLLLWLPLLRRRRTPPPRGHRLLGCAAALLLLPAAAQASPVVVLAVDRTSAGERAAVLFADREHEVLRLDGGKLDDSLGVIGADADFLCPVPSNELTEFTDRLDAAQKLLDELHTDGARERLAGMEHTLTCLREPPDNESLWRLHFLNALLEHYQGHADSTTKHLRAAVATRPAAPYDGSYPPDLGDRYRGLQQAGLGAESALLHTNPAPGWTLWVDGRPITNPLHRLLPGRHLIQVRTTVGLRGFFLDLAASQHVIIAPPQRLADLASELSADEQVSLRDQILRKLPRPPDSDVWIDDGDSTLQLGAPPALQAASVPVLAPHKRLAIALGGGYLHTGGWHYGALGLDVSVGVVGPLRVAVFGRPSFGQAGRWSNGNETPKVVPVLTPFGVVAEFQLNGPVRPRFGVGVQLAANPDGTDDASRFLAGVAGRVGLDIPLAGPLAFRVQGEVGNLERLLQASVMGQLVLSFGAQAK